MAQEYFFFTGGTGLIPGWGTKIQHAGLCACLSQRKKKQTNLISDACERHKQAGNGAMTQELDRLHFYSQRKNGDGRRPPSSSFLGRCQASIISSSSTSSGGDFCLIVAQSAQPVMVLR